MTLKLKPDGGKLKIQERGHESKLSRCGHRRNTQLWIENEDREIKREANLLSYLIRYTYQQPCSYVEFILLCINLNNIVIDMRICHKESIFLYLHALAILFSRFNRAYI